MSVARVTLAALLLLTTVADAGVSFLPSGSATTARLVGTVLNVFAANPFSTSCGLTEALNQCPVAGKCVLLFPASECAVPARSTWASSVMFSAGARDDVTILGYGPASYIHLTDNTGSNRVVLFELTDVENWQIRGMQIGVDEQCVSGCGTGGPPAVKADSALIHITGSSENIEIADSFIHSTESITSDTSSPSYRLIWAEANTATTPDLVPENVYIHDDVLSASGRGVEWQHCSYCRMVNNESDLHGRPDDANNQSPVSFVSLLKYEGIGDVWTGNSVDMSMNGYATVPFMVGVGLSKDFASVTAGGINHGIELSDSSIFWMRTSAMQGVSLVGYDNAMIHGITFQTSRCDGGGATRSCDTDEQCSDLTPGTCGTSGAIGIVFEADTVDNVGGNQNSIVGPNQFFGFANSGISCPILVNDPASGTDALENTGNLFIGNTCTTNDSTKDCFCGSESRLDANHSLGNQNVNGGATSVAEIHQFCGLAPAQNTDFFMGRIPAGPGALLKRFSCISTGAGTTPTVAVQECDSAGANCSTNTTSDVSCGTSGGATTTFGGAAGAHVDGDDWLKYDSTNVGTVAQTAYCLDWKGR